MNERELVKDIVIILKRKYTNLSAIEAMDLAYQIVDKVKERLEIKDE